MCTVLTRALELKLKNGSPEFINVPFQTETQLLNLDILSFYTKSNTDVQGLNINMTAPFYFNYVRPAVKQYLVQVELGQVQNIVDYGYGCDVALNFWHVFGSCTCLCL